MADLEYMYDIKEIENLETAIIQTKNFISQNIDERLANIRYQIGKVDDLKALNENTQEIKQKLNVLNNKILQLESLLQEIINSSAIRVFHDNNINLPANQKDGTVAFIYENK